MLDHAKTYWRFAVRVIIYTNGIFVKFIIIVTNYTQELIKKNDNNDNRNGLYVNKK